VNVDLQFNGTSIGKILEVFYSDDTGYGVFHPTASGKESADIKRVRDYIAFSEEWHTRLKQELPHATEEWDQFADVFEATWQTVDPEGNVSKIDGPVFMEGEITWRSA
jgi:hypothetical protein